MENKVRKLVRIFLRIDVLCKVFSIEMKINWKMKNVSIVFYLFGNNVL